MDPFSSIEDLSPSIEVLADDLNAAWARFEATIKHYRAPASVPIPEVSPAVALRWCRCGGEWQLVVGDDRGGQAVYHAPLATRVCAAVVAKDLRAALVKADDEHSKDIRAAISLLDRATSGGS